jgi:cell wall-associated NlpC family hydrolase
MLLRPFLALVLLAAAAPAQDNAPRTASLQPSDLREYESLTPEIRSVIDTALKLSALNLTYTYGSNTPGKGGMDCSGTINHLLSTLGIPGVPRQANEIYRWTWKNGVVQSVASASLDSFELERLKPGDLLFWSGTYEVQREPPVTHVMLYLGRKKENGKRVMFGASSGRRYEGNSMNGVSVFDFVLPPANDKTRFIGYGPIPGLPPGPPAETAPTPDTPVASLPEPGPNG